MTTLPTAEQIEEAIAAEVPASQAPEGEEG